MINKYATFPARSLIMQRLDKLSLITQSEVLQTHVTAMSILQTSEIYWEELDKIIRNYESKQPQPYQSLMDRASKVMDKFIASKLDKPNQIG